MAIRLHPPPFSVAAVHKILQDARDAWMAVSRDWQSAPVLVRAEVGLNVNQRCVSAVSWGEEGRAETGKETEERGLGET